MAKPKGKRSLTAAEAQHRARVRLKIINEEMNKVGIKPLTAYMPPAYLQALRAYEEGFHTEQNMVKTVIHSSTWLCVAVENFIKQAAESMSNSRVAQIYNSNEWVSPKDLRFGEVATNATNAIYEFEQKHERSLE